MTQQLTALVMLISFCLIGNNLTAQTAVSLSGGVLTITGSSADETYVISNNGANLNIYCSINDFTFSGGAFLASPNNVQVDFASVTDIIVDGSSGGLDLVTFSLTQPLLTRNVTTVDIDAITQENDLITSSGNITLNASTTTIPVGIAINGNVQSTTGLIAMDLSFSGFNFNTTININGTGSISSQYGGININGTLIVDGGSIASTGTGANAAPIDLISTNVSEDIEVMILIQNNASITTFDGALTMSGMMSNHLYAKDGIIIDNSTVNAAGNGDISIYGQGGIFYSSYETTPRSGVAIKNDATLSVVNGNLEIIGDFPEIETATNATSGVLLYNVVNISSTGIGTINIYGKGYGNPDDSYPDISSSLNEGLHIAGDVNINSVYGDITLRGDSPFSTMGFSHGIYISNLDYGDGSTTTFTINSTGTGPNAANITMLGASGNTSAAIFNYGSYLIINSIDGELTLNTQPRVGVLPQFSVVGEGIILQTPGAQMNITGDGIIKTETNRLNIDPKFLGVNSPGFEGIIGKIADLNDLIGVGFIINSGGDLRLTSRDDQNLIVTLATQFPGSLSDDIDGVDFISDFTMPDPGGKIIFQASEDGVSGDFYIERSFSQNKPIEITARSIFIRTLNNPNETVTYTTAPNGIITNFAGHTQTTASELILDGSLAPGGDATIGQFNVEGNVTFTTLGAYNADLGVNENDVLNLTGAAPQLNLNDANLVLNGLPDFESAEFILINVAGIEPVIGTFNNLAEGGAVVIAGNTYTISYQGGDGNDVTLKDLEDPVAACQDITVALGEDGTTIIDAQELNGGSTDNTTTLTYAASPAVVGCDNISTPVQVTLTVTDANGNSDTCTATVTVVDNMAPNVVCSNIIVALDNSGNATITTANIDAGTEDNCGIASLTVSPSTFNASNLGDNTVTLTATDSSSNSSSCTATVTVVEAGCLLYVDKNASGNNDGSNWANAYTNLQDAVTTAATCATSPTIYVAEGTYYPTATSDRSISFDLISNLSIYGGFSPANGITEIFERDFRTYETILSGDIGTSGVITDNSYSVVSTTGVSDIIFDGFIIQDGNSSASTGENARGGGWYNDGGFINIANTIFRNNNANVSGGAMYNLTNNTTSAPINLNIAATKFFNNNASYGGALYNDATVRSNNTTIENCLFSGNTASSTTRGGAAIYNIIFTNEPLNVSVVNTTFAGNTIAATDGTVILNRSFGTSSALNLNLTNCIIWDNENGSGAGTAIDDQDGVVTSISYSLVEGINNTVNNGLDGADPANEPLFTNANSDDYTLQIGSPAIDMGDNTAITLTEDLNGNDRIVDGDGNGTATVDLGAYEAATSPCVILPTNIVYVDENAAGNEDGTDWANAFTKLQDAIYLIENCTNVNTIHVATGTYYPDEGEIQVNNSRTSYFTLTQDVTLLGGFPTGGGTLAERDWDAFPTILNGNIQQDTDETNNSYHVILTENLSNASLIDGFTVREGFQNGITNQEISFGAGILNTNSSPVLNNLLIVSNKTEYGGGIANINNANVLLTNSVIRDNEGDIFGGGIYNETSIIEVVNSTVDNNTASYGGGISIRFNSELRVTNSTLSRNDDSAIRISNDSHLMMRNSIIWNNTSYDTNGFPTTTTTGASISVVNSSTADLAYNLIVNSGGSGTNWETAIGTDNGNNIDTDPLFTDPDNGDYTLQNGSPAIDVGDNTAITLTQDLNGNDRIVDGDDNGTATVDLGAFESPTVIPQNVNVRPIVFLQGALTNPYPGDEQWMRDDLRQATLIPTTSPYADGLVADASVFTTVGADAIVDWVWVELRSATDASVVVYSTSALLQRDGDVVDVDGSSPVNIDGDAGSYYVAINHRNTLGILSSSTYELDNSSTTVDLSSDTNTIEGGGNAALDMGNGIYAMISGDYDANSQVQSNDAVEVLPSIGSTGYSFADMDSNTQVQTSDVQTIIYPNIGLGQQYARVANNQQTEVTYTLDNATLTEMDGSSYYEADLFIQASVPFKLGSGQLYFNYSTEAFGSDMVVNNRIIFSAPEDAILAESNTLDVYELHQLDNTDARVSFNWVQKMSAGSIAENNVTQQPRLLAHVKILLQDAAGELFFCFEDDDDTLKGVSDQTFTAAGPSDLAIADHIDSPSVQIKGASFNCSAVGATLSNGESSVAQNLKLHPNPANGFVSITGLKSPAHVMVYDLNGRTIFEKQDMEDGTIDISQWEASVYMVHIQNSEQSATKRLIKY